MYFPVEGTSRTFLFFTVLLSWAIFVETFGERTLKLKIGFDLTQGKNGAPSLRIRNFEDSSRLRAAEDEETIDPSPVPSVRTDSFSESREDEKRPYKEDSSREDKNSSEDENDSPESKIRSTKGLNPGEYEPEENAKVHARYQDEDDSEDEAQRRHKRGAEYVKKMKGKKFRSLRKHGASKMQWH